MNKIDLCIDLMDYNGTLINYEYDVKNKKFTNVQIIIFNDDND